MLDDRIILDRVQSIMRLAFPRQQGPIRAQVLLENGHLEDFP